MAAARYFSGNREDPGDELGGFRRLKVPRLTTISSYSIIIMLVNEKLRNFTGRYFVPLNLNWMIVNSLVII